MKLKIVIVDFELSPHAKKRLLRIGVPLATLLGGATVAYAGGNWALPNQWSMPGNPGYAGPNLKAADLDANFAALADAGAALDMRTTALESGRFIGVVSGKMYSVGATSFVKETSTGGPNNDGTYDGAHVGGYSGAKAACEAATGSASAHMCTSDEIARSAAVGVASPAVAGWYAGVYQGADSADGSTRYNDCYGFTLNTSNNLAFWGSTNHSGGSWAPAAAACSTPIPILCCD